MDSRRLHRTRAWRGALAGCVLALTSALTFAAEAININTADAETLASALQGVGPNKAAAIVHYREMNGPFPSVEALSAVRGIGKRTVEINRERLRVE